MIVQITNYGGRVVNLWVKDRNGNFEDIVLGYESLEDYFTSNEIYFGAHIGRYANRIAGGRFSLNDSTYKLAQNFAGNNLHGAGNGVITDHLMQINADLFTPFDNQGGIPNGRIATVEGTPMDFRHPVTIGERIEEDYDQLVYGLGYDHSWVLNADESGLTFAARVVEPSFGRTLEVYTNEPAMQFYSGNYMDGRDTGKYRRTYDYRAAFCLETQHYPDSPNHVHFPSTILDPGEVYTSICIYKFGLVTD